MLLSFPLVEIERIKYTEVEKTINSRNHYNILQYSIKWLQFLITNNNWLKDEELDKAEEYVINFYRKYFKNSYQTIYINKNVVNVKRERNDKCDSWL